MDASNSKETKCEIIEVYREYNKSFIKFKNYNKQDNNSRYNKY